MTTRTTTIRTSGTGMRAVLGAAASLAILGGTLLWQARPASEPATPAATTSFGTDGEGAAPLGGLAEQYRDQQQARAERLTTRGGDVSRLERMGGMAELYRDQAATAGAR